MAVNMRTLAGILLAILQFHALIRCDDKTPNIANMDNSYKRCDGKPKARLDFSAAKTGSNKLKRVCYYTPFHHVQPNLTALNLTLCTHVIYGFAHVEKNFTLGPKNATLDPGRYKNFTSYVKSLHPEVKTLLCVSEGNFSLMVNTSKNIKKFLRSTMKKLQAWGFDGLDVDWEFPKRDDRKNFVVFLQEANATLKKSNKLLAIALPVWSRYINKSYNDTAMVKNMSDAIDFANIMAYDYNVYNYRYRNFTGPNAPLYQWTSRTPDDSQRYVEWSVEYWSETLKMPKEKIVVGIPFFGRRFNLTDAAQKHQFWAGAQNSTFGWGGKVTFNWTCSHFLNRNAIVVYDNASRTPYAYNVRKSTWVSYDNRKSVCEKIKNGCG
ncbi:acidic mammalian chitinase-like isoform X2 [Ornithodoros turicata]|uniref:acidic mammalian chitinase-like isoform X2 n=1 Tax=Ornithodoros turicata TaxID=34597 RepID=UPI0031391A72